MISRGALPGDSEFVARLGRNGTIIEERVFNLEDFINNKLVIITRGQKVAYVGDASISKENRGKIIRLASGSLCYSQPLAIVLFIC